MFLAVKYGFDGVVDASEVGRLYLCHVPSLLFSERFDVFQCVAPLVCNDFSVDTVAVHRCADSSQSIDLCFALAHINWSFYTQVERFCYFCHFANVFGDSLEVVVEHDAECTVDVDMECWVVAFAWTELEHAVAEPLYIFLNLFAFQSNLCLNVIEKCVGKHVCTLHYHLVCIQVSVVSRLREDRNHLLGNLCAIFIGYYLCH